MSRRIALSLLLGLLGSTAWSDSVVFLVRHAEKVDDSRDAELTRAGRSRARMLAEMLRDAGIEAVYSTDFIRTRETARPMVETIGTALELYENLADLVARLETSSKTALVVGHSNTTPELVELLGGEPGPPIADDEYDRMYVVVLSGETTSTTTVLRLPPPSP